MRFRLKLIALSLFASIVLSPVLRAEVFKVAMPSTTQAVLAFTIARDKGYYRAEGLDVELILMSAPKASRALLSGDVGVATVGGAGLAAGAARVADEVFVHDLQPGDVLALRKAGDPRRQESEGQTSRRFRYRQRAGLLAARGSAAERSRCQSRCDDSKSRRDADDLCRTAKRYGGWRDAFAAGDIQSGRGGLS